MNTTERTATLPLTHAAPTPAQTNSTTPIINTTKQKVDGVGTGALEAAARHAGVDVGALVTWKPGEPVPYAFLTSTFEAIAETTKRLEIVAALTGE